MATLVFIHGLNTYGDDLIHVGPLTFGPMHRHLEKAFEKHDVSFVAVTGLGAASPREQADRAFAFLTEAGLVDDGGLHLFGQSIGGLVARELACREEIRHQVHSVITMGTPHQGTKAAAFALEFPERYPFLHRVFSSIGYDARVKAASFRHFTPDALSQFNETCPAPAGAREISLICEVTREEVSWPLMGLYNRLHKTLEDGRLESSDGFILSSSQRRGEELGPFALDHFAQLGAFFHVSSTMRRKAAAEFDRMVETVVGIVSK